jgi:predicted O-linked N-acetylglucosamine transferase (SPINDLY family)
VQGDQPAVIDAYRNALRSDPRRPKIHSGLIFAMFHDAACSPADRLREAAAWNEVHATPLASSIAPHRNRRDPDRRLRIGYLSPDFVEHPCARIGLPIIRSHDRDGFEVFCYADLQRPDAMTQRVRAAADGWRDITRLTDQQAAEAIREDGIDVLIDLAGHMGRSRLAIFARKPAPVQMQLTFPGTTGLATMDYRITDGLSDPPGIGEQQHTERLIRLPCAWCYDPGDLPPVGPLPALRRNGAVTFGCLNRPMKITAAAVEAWSAILRGLPGSRMLLLSGTTNGRNEHLAALLLKHGLDERRVRLVARVPRARYLELFNEIDIALDPFPYNGEATTLDGLWTGVPLITLVGDSCVSRRGMGHLTHIGLEELIARDTAHYAQRAVELGQNVQRLAALRASLRERMRASPAGNTLAYTRELEAAVRQAWIGWCGRENSARR